MSKKISFLSVLILISAVLLAGCCIQHEWEEATCTTPKTCVKCGETEGEPLGHSFVDATCVSPATCEICGFTMGEPLGHSFSRSSCTEPGVCSVCGYIKDALAEHTWIEATCVMPRHCSVCGVTEGTTVAHKWAEANFDSPRTCTVCGATEGDALKPYVASAQDFSYTLASGAKQNYSTITGYDNRIANGTVTVLSYNKYSSDATHPYKEGYEWREVKVQFSMDKASRVMWGYTDVYTGLNDYAQTNYITYQDGTREKVEATQSFSSEVILPPVTPTPSPTPTPTPEPTQAPTQAAGSNSGATPSQAVSTSPPVAPQITPSPTPTPVPTPDSEPDKYQSYVTQAVQVPIKYKGLIFYVCNADYELDHKVDNDFQFMKMD